MSPYTESTTEPKEYPISSNHVPPRNIPRKPIPSSTTTAYTPATHNTRQASLLSRLHTRWTLLHRRTRIILICSVLALAIFIIALAAGLSRKSGNQNLPLPSAHGGPYTGDFTYYEPGLGACGVTSSSSDDIVSVSHFVFDAAQSGSDPNQNPLCGKKLRAKRVKEGSGERSVDLTVVDRCVGCKSTDIDVSLSVFKKLADQDLGRVTVTWSWLE